MRAVSASVAFLKKIGRGRADVDLEQVSMGVEGRMGTWRGEEGESLFGMGFVGVVQARVLIPCEENVRVGWRPEDERVLYGPEMAILSLCGCLRYKALWSSSNIPLLVISPA